MQTNKYTLQSTIVTFASSLHHTVSYSLENPVKLALARVVVIIYTRHAPTKVSTSINIARCTEKKRTKVLLGITPALALCMCGTLRAVLVRFMAISDVVKEVLRVMCQ